MTLNNLAQVYMNLDLVDEGLECHGKALDIQLKSNDFDVKKWVFDALSMSDAFL